MSGERNISVTKGNINLKIDPTSFEDVIRCLVYVKFKSVVVVKNINILPKKLLIDFAFTLKMFHEIDDVKFKLVLVGDEVFTLYNGDLTGRIGKIQIEKK